MKVNRLSRIILLAALCAPICVLFHAPRLAAQTPREAGVFAPFVSRLTGEVKNNLVRLSWVDSRDARGPVYIFRSAFPFDGAASSPAAAPAAVVPYGIGEFVDEVEADVTVYYFAAASGESGERYDIPIAFTNTVEISGESGARPLPEAAAPARAEAAAPIAGGISGLVASVRGERVVIRFERGNVENAALYRSSRPITGAQGLLGAVIVGVRVSSPFTDYPVPGIPSYYAVIDEDDLRRGTVRIIPGVNATGEAAETAASGGGGAPGTGRSIRAMPLPEITTGAILPGTAARAETPSPRGLSPQAARALRGVPGRGAAEPAIKKPRVFARDMEPPEAGGEDYALRSIVQGPFAAKNWEAAGEGFARFLTLPRSPDSEARARFYLGQCRYFTGRWKDGLFEFFAIEDRFPAESAEWIRSSLAMMRE